MDFKFKTAFRQVVPVVELGNPLTFLPSDSRTVIGITDASGDVGIVKAD